MRQNDFSRTALGAAGHRAAHQVLEGGRFFADPLAVRILGPDAQAAIEKARANPERRGLRLLVAVRSRFAEEAAHEAIRRGVRQVVVLGAGLDTFAHRVAPEPGLVVFEVDHPATQAEKRRRLAAASVAEPAHVVLCRLRLRNAGPERSARRRRLPPAEASFFFWLGVTPYLTPEAVFATLAAVAALPGGAEIVFDYVVPPEAIGHPAARQAHENLAEKVAAAGEPLIGYFDAASLHARLAAFGFVTIKDFGAGEIAARYAPASTPTPRGAGARLLRAATPAR